MSTRILFATVALSLALAGCGGSPETSATGTEPTGTDSAATGTEQDGQLTTADLPGPGDTGTGTTASIGEAVLTGRENLRALDKGQLNALEDTLVELYTRGYWDLDQIPEGSADPGRFDDLMSRALAAENRTSVRENGGFGIIIGTVKDGFGKKYIWNWTISDITLKGLKTYTPNFVSKNPAAEVKVSWTHTWVMLERAEGKKTTPAKEFTQKATGTAYMVDAGDDGQPEMTGWRIDADVDSKKIPLG